jgi:predicted nucleic acid-binding protein
MSKKVSLDASPLINFLRINRIDLLEQISYSFFITDHVEDEISILYPTSPYLSPQFILRTQDIILHMMLEGLLNVDEADEILEEWALKHRFKLKIKSFKELYLASTKK